jgi:hypothetical protein
MAMERGIDRSSKLFQRCTLSKSLDGTLFESRLSLTGKAAWLLADQSKTQISTGHAV